jgi:hypothetical protein
MDDYWREMDIKAGAIPEEREKTGHGIRVEATYLFAQAMEQKRLERLNLYAKSIRPQSSHLSLRGVPSSLDSEKYGNGLCVEKEKFLHACEQPHYRASIICPVPSLFPHGCDMQRHPLGTHESVFATDFRRAVPPGRKDLKSI